MRHVAKLGGLAERESSLADPCRYLRGIDGPKL